MSTGPDPQVENRRVDGTRQQIDQLVEEIARLAETDLGQADFYSAFLQRVLQALAAPAGAVWMLSPQGHLLLQYQANLHQVGLDRTEAGRQSHDELLRRAVQQAQPLQLPPQSSTGTSPDGQPTPGNPTDFLLLLAPILVDRQVTGLVEVWQSPECHPRAIPGFGQFLNRMAELASHYQRNQQHRQMIGEHQLLTQLEAFALQIQGSLHPTEVAYLVANEGRRLLECDRLSVAVRYGRRVLIEAVSGSETVEKRSKQVRLMRTLCRQVLAWGERLVFRGVQDDSLPPDVLETLDTYLEESTCKLLVVLPLRDARERESRQPPRSALLLESFEPTAAPDQLLGRLEVIGKHATRALYNAVEHRRIPLRWLWQPLAWVQEGLGGQARAIGALIVAAIGLLVGMLVFVPYPLKMEAKGQLLPQERRWIYAPVEGTIVHFAEGVQPGSLVAKDQALILMDDMQLELKQHQLRDDVVGAHDEAAALAGQLALATTETDRRRISAEKREKEFLAERKQRELDALQERTHAEKVRPGTFWLQSPLSGTVLNSDFRETLTNRYVKPADPLLRIGDKDKRWEIELKIPQQHIGQVLRAFPPGDPNAELDVDLVVLSAPTHTFKGKLARDKVEGEASPNRDDPTASEPVVLASVRIDGPDIAPDERIPRDLLVSGTEVHGKIRCGKRPMGYALFYGVWEFVYDKVFLFS